MAHYIIYIPGLEDHRYTYTIQYLIMRAWSIFGIHPLIKRMHWIEKSPFAPRLSNLVEAIDNLYAKGHAVSLVGVSAGASVALNAFSQRERAVHRVVCICGKINNPQTISAKIYKNNPAFKESLTALQTNLPTLDTAMRKRIMSIHPKQDNAVPVPDTIIEGAIEKPIPTSGHGVSIFYAITVGSLKIVNFIRQ